MKKIYLIDGNNFIYRMFYGLPEFSTKDGKIVNAIFGMGKFFVQQMVREKPDYLFFIRDAKGDNFRHKLYKEYKSTRDRMPDNLVSQINDIEKMISLMGIKIIEIEGYEADDVIGTLANNLRQDKNNDIYILSGDKDLYSLVNGNVKMYDTMKKKIFNKEETNKKFGVNPEMIIDYLAIVGDKSDNIPGIDGFGPKKAVGLINKIGGVDEIYNEVQKVEKGEKTFNDYDKEIASVFKGKTFEKLINSKENAFLSKKLATIDIGVEIEGYNLDDYIFSGENILNEDVYSFFKELEFFSLIGNEEKKLKKWKDLGLKVNVIQNITELKDLEKKLNAYNKIVLDTETTSINIIKAQLVGISIYLDDDNIYYINRLHNGEKLLDQELKKFIKNLFSLDILIVGHNIKYDLQILELFLGKALNDNNKNSSETFGQMSLKM